MEEGGLEALFRRVPILVAFDQDAFSAFNQEAFAAFSQVGITAFSQVAFVTFTHQASILEAFTAYDASSQGACQEETIRLEATSSFMGVLALGVHNTTVVDSLVVEVYTAVIASANASNGDVTWGAIKDGLGMAA